MKSVSKASLCSLKDGDELSAAPRPDPPVWRGGGGEPGGHGGPAEQPTQTAPAEGDISYSYSDPPHIYFTLSRSVSLKRRAPSSLLTPDTPRQSLCSKLVLLEEVEVEVEDWRDCSQKDSARQQVGSWCLVNISTFHWNLDNIITFDFDKIL